MVITDDKGFTLVDWDAPTGRSIWSYFTGEKTVYRIDYPVAEMVKANAIERNLAPAGFKGDWHKVASIPLNILHDSGMAEASRNGDEAFMSKWLNSSDNRAWRTKEGTV